ncbi:MAG: thioredoxin family protein [Verrucomicrobiota bacterium]
MKFPQLLMMLALLVSPSCERARGFTSQILKTQPAPKASSVSSEPLVVELSSGQMDSFSKQRGRVTIIQYQAVWSGESRRIDPLLLALTEEYGGKVVVGKVDIDRFHQFATSQGVKDLPDLRIYRDGKFVRKIVGLRDEDEIRGILDPYTKGIEVSEAPVISAAHGKPVAEPMRKDWMPDGMRRR